MQRSPGVALITAAGLSVLAGCAGSSEDSPQVQQPDGVTMLLAGPGDGELVVDGQLFATPATEDRDSSIELCDSVGPADVEDVPFYECRGGRVAVESEVYTDIDPLLLDLGWSDADGRSEYSAVVSLVGELDGDELHVVEVRRRGEPVTAVRSDAADRFAVAPGEVDLCERLPGTEFGRPPPDDTYVDVDGSVRTIIDWDFDDRFVTEFSGDVLIESTWSCFGNRVRWFGTRYEARLTETDGLLMLVQPDGFVYLEHR